MKITKEKFAAKLEGTEYPLFLSKKDEALLKENNLVVVRGGSDDIMRFHGSIDDEIAAPGKCVVVPVGGSWTEIIENVNTVFIRQPKIKPAVFEVIDEAKVQGNVIEAIWCPEDEEGKVTASWAYKTEIPHTVFKIEEDDEVYCFGIVFSMDDVKQ